MRPDYYGNQYRNSTYLQAITHGPGLYQPATLPPGYVPPIVGTLANGPNLAGPTDQLFYSGGAPIGVFEIGETAIGQWPGPIIGITVGLIGGGGKVQYYPAYATTSAAGQLTIGISAIGAIKPYHETITIVGGVAYEAMWGIGYSFFILDQSPLDGPFVLAP